MYLRPSTASWQGRSSSTSPILSRPTFRGIWFRTGGSAAREIAKAVPGSASIVKAFNTQNAGVLNAARVEGRSLDVFVAGDDDAAKTKVAIFINDLGFRPMDVGVLDMAWTLERACMLWLGLMKNSVGHTDFAIGVDVLD